MRALFAGVILAIAGTGHSSTQVLTSEVAATRGPGILTLAAPIDTWDEAIPLGNGLLGALLWGHDNVIRLSLDRGDLWDLRRPEIFSQPDWNYQTMQRLKADGNQDDMNRLFDTPYESIPYPTKLPAGRVEVTLPPEFEAQEFSLDLGWAASRASFSNGSALTAFVAAESPVVLMSIPGTDFTLSIAAPAAVSTLGYAAATQIDEDGFTGYFQEGVLGLRYGVLARVDTRDVRSVVAMTVFASKDGSDPLPAARLLLRQALDTGYDSLYDAHTSWWKAFWSISSVTIPDERLQRHYDLARYFYGAASRPGAPPMPLQGVWTADDGRLPPWKGDYHNDLNTQMSYLAYQTAGLLDAGESFLRFMSGLLPQFRTFARTFYGVDGAVVPGVMTLTGEAMGGWGQYSLSPTNGAWVSQLFARHWRYSRDAQFLTEVAYPFCHAVATALAQLLRPGADGLLRLPLSTSPEIFDNSMRAWLPPMSSYDLALVRSAFADMAELETARGQPAEARTWTDLLAKLPQDIVDPATHSLMVAEGLPLDRSHRHFSHAMAIHPLGQYDVRRADDARVINGTIDTIARTGTAQWVGYSFSWFASMLASAGRADEALHYLTHYERSFTLRNGFHVNGEQTREGLSNYHYRPFTLEGNFLAMDAIHNMLLQSQGGLIRLFPAVSSAWQDVSFSNLRAEGGFKVSAERRGGRIVAYRVVATVDGPMRMLDPVDGREIVTEMKQGQIIGKRWSARMPRASARGRLEPIAGESRAARPPSDWQ